MKMIKPVMKVVIMYFRILFCVLTFMFSQKMSVGSGALSNTQVSETADDGKHEGKKVFR